MTSKINDLFNEYRQQFVESNLAGQAGSRLVEDLAVLKLRWAGYRLVG